MTRGVRLVQLVGLALCLSLCARAARVGETINSSKLQDDSGGQSISGKRQDLADQNLLSTFRGLFEGGSESQQTGGGGSGSGSGSLSSNEVPPYKGAPQSQDSYKQESPVGGGSQFQAPQTNEKGELPLMFNLSELTQLIWSPFDLVKRISDTFKLSQSKFIEKIGKGAVFGVEAMLTPVIASLKIIEKVFVPDHCRLKLVCQIGSKFAFVKETIAKFSPALIHGTHHLKALTDGITGQDCEALFKDCGLKLRKPYEELKSY